MEEGKEVEPIYLSIYPSLESACSVNYVSTKYHSLFGSDCKPN